MPALPSPSTWRTHPQTAKGYLYILNPTVVLSRRVNQAVFSYPVTTLAYDNPDADGGSFADVVVGQTLKISSSTGELKCYARVKGITSTLISIAPLSRGDVASGGFADNDRLEIWNDFRLWSKIPQITPAGVQLKDYDQVFLAVSAQPPVANCGSWYANKIDPDTELITVDFDGTDSFPVADGATITTYEWDVQDGTITVGTSASSQITATFPAGYRWISLTVTDSNSNTHTARALVVAATEATALQAIVSQLQGNLDNGWSAGFQLLESDVSDYPAGTAVIFWVDEKYGNTTASLNGYPDREHVKFCGWITDDNTVIDPYFSDWTIVAQNAYGVLGGLPAFSQTTERSASPTSWYQVANLTWWRHVHYLMQWHSNVLELCDVERPAFYAAYDILRLDADAGTIIDQFKFAAEAVSARFTVDSRGRCYWRRNPHLMSSADRASLTTIVTLQDSDWTERLDVPTRHRPQVNVIFGSAIVAHASQAIAVKAAAPGTTPGQGGRQESVDRWLVNSQSDLNERLGRLYALQNIDEPRLPITILNQGMIADPAWQEWIAFTMSVANKRGKSYTGQKFVLASVSVRYDNATGTSLENWELEKTASDTAASAITVQLPGADPPVGDDPYIPTDGTYLEQFPIPYELLPLPDYTPDIIVDEPPDSTFRRAIAWSDVVRLTTQARDDNPTWDLIFNSQTVRDVVQEVDSTYPDGDTLGLYVLTAERLYYSANVIPASPTFDLQQSYTDRDYRTLRTAAGVDNSVLVMGKGAATNGTWEATFDFTTSLYNFLIPTANTDDPYYELKISEGDWGEWVDTSGVEARVGQEGGYQKRAQVGVDVEPMTITEVIGVYDYAIGGVGGTNRFVALTRNTDGAAANLTRTNEPPDGTDETISWMGSISNVTAITFVCCTAFNAGSPAGVDSGSATLKSLTIKGTGFNPFADKQEIRYSADNGATDSTLEVSQRSDEFAFDTDDYNVGVIVAGSNRRPRSNTGYETDDFEVVPYLPRLRPRFGVRVSCVRVPFKKLASQAANNDPASFQFIYGADGGIAENGTGSDQTLWGVNFNAVTRDPESVVISNMTPTLNGSPYYVIGPHALETAGLNTQKILAFCKPVAGGNTRLLASEDGGVPENWQDKGELDGEYVKFIPGTLSAWLSGNAGIFFTDDLGDTLAERTGDMTGSINGAVGFDD